MGPVITDVLALLGRGALFRAPFRNSISRACRPTMRSSGSDFAVQEHFPSLLNRPFSGVHGQKCNLLQV
jgi:hypothetical protein